jgi:hypothetical protein
VEKVLQKIQYGGWNEKIRKKPHLQKNEKLIFISIENFYFKIRFFSHIFNIIVYNNFGKKFSFVLQTISFTFNMKTVLQTIFFLIQMRTLIVQAILILVNYDD